LPTSRAAQGNSKWPHPYHGSAAKRRASRHLRSSHSTVSPEGMCSVPGASSALDVRLLFTRV
jgi:hypothetical protein